MKYSLIYRKIVSWTFIIVLVLYSLPCTAEASTVTGTSLSGTISTDTVLTKSNSPYVMSGSVTISPGATLTIEPGVQIIGKGNSFVVDGTLKSQGTKEELITLDNIYISSWNAGTIFLEYVDWNKSGIAAVVRKNSTFTMVRSKFSLGTIDLSELKSDSFIEENLFHTQGTLNLTSGAGRITITGNTFYNEEVTDIIHSCNRYTCTEPNLLIEKNNFLNKNTHIDLRGDSAKTIIAPNNYWGTTIYSRIYASILDGNDYSGSRDKLLAEPIAATPFPIDFELPKIDEPYLEEGVITEGNSTYIKGVAKNAAKAVLKVTTSGGHEVWYEESVRAGRFTFILPRQQRGTKVELYSNNSNEVSHSVFFTVEKTFFPVKPFVYSVTPDDTAIKGVTTPDTTIEVAKNNEVLASGISSATGEFEIPIASQVEGDVLTVYAVNGESKSEQASVTVGTPLEQEAPVFKELNYLYHQSYLQGVTEPNIKIQVRVNHLLTDEYTTDGNGWFGFGLTGQQDDLVEVTAVDQNNNRSTPVVYTLQDWIKPIFHPSEFSNDQDLYIGQSESGVTITVQKGDQLLASGLTNADGSFALPITRQAAGTQLTVKATDQNGNVFEIIQTVSDVVPPSIDKVSTFFEGDTVINGKAEPASTIILFINNVQQPNTVKVNADGMFKMDVPLHTAGDEIKLLAVDQARNMSSPYVLSVQKLEPPKSPVVNSVSDYSNLVTGTVAKENLLVKVFKGTEVLGEGTSNAKGEFSIPISTQAAGSTLSVTAFNERQQPSEPTTVVVEDRTAPMTPTASQVTDQSTSITGTSEPFSTVVILKDGVVLTQANVGENGNYEASISKQPAHSTLELFARDLANNESTKTLITVKDVTAPTVFVDAITNKSTSITGISNEDGRIVVKNGSEMIKSAEMTAGNTFTIKIPAQKEGTTLTLFASDVAGNEASPISTLVKDVIAPAAPQVNKVGDNAKEVTGKAESGATVKVFSGTKLLGYASSSGLFKVVIPIQKAGTVLSVKAYDPAGNVSTETKVTVTDVTAPAKPIVNVIKNTTAYVTGKAEPKSKVRIYNGSVQIGYGDTNTLGNFTIKIPVQKIGVILTATATDLAGNRSSATTMVVQDGIAPGVPKVNAVYSTSSYVSGKAEANSTITIKSGSKIIGTSKADRYGNYKVKIVRQKRGITLVITATDAAKNTSKPAYTKVR
ncbi:Ig-like domain-containing protein [Neobacillus vireti]|uniref:Ig-like domain-containing protein n=1 Tax=Neobacillus vireti TaxID=220686 RepID=UPI002FFFF09C